MKITRQTTWKAFKGKQKHTIHYGDCCDMKKTGAGEFTILDSFEAAVQDDGEIKKMAQERLVKSAPRETLMAHLFYACGAILQMEAASPREARVLSFKRDNLSAFDASYVLEQVATHHLYKNAAHLTLNVVSKECQVVLKNGLVEFVDHTNLTLV